MVTPFVGGAPGKWEDLRPPAMWGSQGRMAIWRVILLDAFRNPKETLSNKNRFSPCPPYFGSLNLSILWRKGVICLKKLCILQVRMRCEPPTIPRAASEGFWASKCDVRPPKMCYAYDFPFWNLETAWFTPLKTNILNLNKKGPWKWINIYYIYFIETTWNHQCLGSMLVFGGVPPMKGTCETASLMILQQSWPNLYPPQPFLWRSPFPHAGHVVGHSPTSPKKGHQLAVHCHVFFGGHCVWRLHDFFPSKKEFHRIHWVKWYMYIPTWQPIKINQM